MKIYFAGSIRGGRSYIKFYKNIIQYLNRYGTVLTEHIAQNDITNTGETLLNDNQIFNRDISWLRSSDLFISEVSSPSLGVGYEIGMAEQYNIPILCLYKEQSTFSLSAMVSGNQNILCKNYTNWVDIKMHIDSFINIYN
tara:strand:+ start:235 stop:654 length:420 start_codon:yes stop_codon:yes gene_type:complete